MKKHIILFDGTWNKPDLKIQDGDENTNVFRIKELIKPITKEGVQQVVWYEPGVGTDWYNKICGGTFGVGLSKKIQEAYKHLIENYNKGDDIYIFGFSRGAYSARSLVGLIRNAGLLNKNKIELINEAYHLYRTRDEGPDIEPAINFRKENSIEIKIKFIGIWDTVGSLGVPLESFDGFNKKFYEFHDTNLSEIVENAFHALAIDENRENFSATLWTPKEKPNQRLEQVWFSGAHANVGGGYKNDHLADISLQWMANKAEECGLELNKIKQITINASNMAIRDSYNEFMGGAYKIIKPRYYRTIGGTQYGNESIDPSSIQKMQDDPSYKPKNININRAERINFKKL